MKAGYSVMSPSFTTLFSLIPACYLVSLWQKQQTQMQEVLRRLSRQEDGQREELQQNPRNWRSSESAEHYALIQNLKQIVAEKEETIKELQEEIQQLSLQVGEKAKVIEVFYILTNCTHFDLKRYLN